jgi:hypothetical protein
MSATKVKRSADFEQGRRDGINMEIAIADDRIDHGGSDGRGSARR